MTTLALTALCFLFGLFFLFTGISSFLQPERFAKSLALAPIGSSGIVEIRAQYGGFFFAAGLVMFASVFRFIAIETALIVSLTIFGGLIMGRLGSLIFDRDRQSLIPIIRALYWVDGIGAILAAGGIFLIWQNGSL